MGWAASFLRDVSAASCGSFSNAVNMTSIRLATLVAGWLFRRKYMKKFDEKGLDDPKYLRKLKALDLRVSYNMSEKDVRARILGIWCGCLVSHSPTLQASCRSPSFLGRWRG